MRRMLWIVVFLGCFAGQAWAEESAEISAIRAKAQQGDAIAQYELGNEYYQGKKNEKNYIKSVEWLKKSSEQGNSSAQVVLSSMYALGYGTTKNHEEEYFWLLISLGEDRRGGYLERAEKLLTPTQIADVQRRAKEWKPVIQVAK